MEGNKDDDDKLGSEPSEVLALSDESERAADCQAPQLFPRVLADAHPAAGAPKVLCSLVEELEATWGELGIPDSERLQDSEAIAAVAVTEARSRVAAWNRRRTELTVHCAALHSKAEACVQALGGELTGELEAAASLPLSSRPEGLQELLDELLCRLREVRAEGLVQLGRRDVGEETAGGVLELAPQVADLREALRQRRQAAAEAATLLRGIWSELGLAEHELQKDPLDAAVQANAKGLGMADAEYEGLLRRRSHWEATFIQRREQLLSLHRHMRELAACFLPKVELAALEGFLSARCSCSDLETCLARERELQAAARRWVVAMDLRRRAALVALGRGREATELSTEVTSDDITAESLCTLAASVEELERELQELRTAAARRGARYSRSIWEELGEEPELPRDAALSAVLAAEEADEDPVVTVEDVLAVDASVAAWEARREKSAKFVERLHKELCELDEGSRAFVGQHGSLHLKDRTACRNRLRMLREAALRAAAKECSVERMQRLRASGSPQETFLGAVRTVRGLQRSIFTSGKVDEVRV